MLGVPLKKEVVMRRGGKIRQSNALVRTKRPYNLMQTQLFYVFLETLKTTDESFGPMESPVPVLRELLRGHYGSFYSDLREAAENLAGTTFGIRKPTGSWAFLTIFKRIEYLKAGDTNDVGYHNRNAYDVVR